MGLYLKSGAWWFFPERNLRRTREGLVYACGDGAKGQLGSKRVPDKPPPDDRAPFSVFKRDLYAEAKRVPRGPLLELRFLFPGTIWTVDRSQR